VKVWRWTCDACGGAGIEFSEGAAEDMLAAHPCGPLPPVPPKLLALLEQQS
jgi:hypothetical protein